MFMNYSIKLKNGQVLRGFMISPGEKTRANIIFIHGLGEHINRYTPWAELFNSEGIGFTGLDLPGHGSSDGRRGHIKSYDLTDEMIDILAEHTRQTFSGLPVFIYGNSLGGGIVLDYLVRKNPGIKGAIVTSPWLRLSFQPDKRKILLASVMKYILPGLVQPSGLIPEQISHNKDVVGEYIADNLVHGKISVSLFHSAMRAARYALSHPAELKVPLLLMHGSDDMICSPEGSREFASGTDLAELKIWEGGYHELHNEYFRDEVFRYIINWMNKLLV
jgi:alpha-beta hydrolase superfamily lysophospholipase